MGTDVLEGKVGRIYMPRQELGTIALQKMKARNAFIFNYLSFNGSSKVHHAYNVKSWQHCDMIFCNRWPSSSRIRVVNGCRILWMKSDTSLLAGIKTGTCAGTNGGYGCAKEAEE